MNLKKINIRLAVALLICGSLASCEQFLDAKPINTLAQPASLKDLRAMLDREEDINNIYPMLAQIPSDELEIAGVGFVSIAQVFQDAYIWKSQELEVGSWRNPYKAISIANVVLETLERIKGGSLKERDQLKGEALFIRGWMLFNLAQVYCAPYQAERNKESLGLVLRLDSDSEIKMGRANLEATYDRILTDLQAALQLLPDQSDYMTRPSKLVVHAALARLYLTIGDYDMAEKMVDEVFKVKDDLTDFNGLNFSSKYPIELSKNKEIIYYAKGYSTGAFTANANTYVAPDLVEMYDNKDLRRRAYFENAVLGMKFRGYYHGMLSDYFAGLAMDEMYLIKAECAARRNDIQIGAFYLNELRRHRFETGHFQNLSFSDDIALLNAVLTERRIELLLRGTRWLDLRRLNLDSRFQKTLVRKMKVNGVEVRYELKPNDLRYVALIPQIVLDVGNYEQNPR